jgi:hypothetical protein
MPDQNSIEEIITGELIGLCSTCAHEATCVYRKQSEKKIIQCEMFEIQIGNDRRTKSNMDIRDLCSSCIKSSGCIYPKAPSGVWRCVAYE